MKKSENFVFDTNTLLSAFMFPDSVPCLALKKAFSSGNIIVSKDTIEELREVMFRSKFDKYLPKTVRQILLQNFEIACKYVNVTKKISVCRDTKDNKFLSLALKGKAKVIVTGDEDLLLLNPFKNTAILTPKIFVNSFLI